MGAVGSFFASIDPGPSLSQVGKAIESGVREIGKGAESLGREIGKVGEAAAKNPIGTIAKVAAVATGQAWALPLISAVDVVAHGGNLEQALKAGAISYAGTVVAAGIADGLNEAFANELTHSVGDASLTATNTLADGTIQHVFSDGSTILQGVDGALSTTPATIAPSVMSQLATQLPTSVLTSINTALANAGGSAAMTALKGGDLSEILLSGASAGAGSFAGTQTTGQLKDLGLNEKVAQVLGRTAGAATAGAVSGQDASQIFNTALVNNIVRTSLAEAGEALKNTEVGKGLTKTLNEAIQPFKDTLAEAKQAFLNEAKKLTDLKSDADVRTKELISSSDTLKTEAETYYNDTLKASEANAQNAYKSASASYTDYKTKKDEFDSLVAKHKEATDAGDIELADSYADKANALIPSLNAAVDKYNTDYAAYDTAKADFETKNTTYTGYVTQLNKLNDEYTGLYKSIDDQLAVVNKSADTFNSSVDEMQNTLNATAKQVEDAYTKTKDYSSIAKDTFSEFFGETGDLAKASNLSQQVNALPEDNQRMYEFAKGFGLKTEDALKFAPDISKMSVVAQQAFYDSLAQNPDATTALTTANEVNSLDKEQQNSFFNAKIQGLNTTEALDVANNVGGASKEQQQVYIDSVKSGLGSPLSSILSAAYGLTTPGSQLESTIDKDLASLKTEEAKNAYKYYLNAYDNKTALALAQGQDQAVLSQGTGTQSAGTSGAYLPPGQTGTVTVSQESSPATPSFVPSAEKIKELDAKLESGQITEAEYDAQYKQLIQPPQQTEYTAPTNTDYYQSLIDRIFTDQTKPVKKLATTTTGAGGATTGPTGPGGATTGPTGPGGTTTGPTGPGGTTTGPTGPGGGGGEGAGTGGTGTGGTGTGGTGTGGGGGFGIGGTGGGGFTIPGGMYGMYGLTGQDQYGGIKNLTAGLTERMDYNLTGLPSDQDVANPMFNAPQIIEQKAAGGSTSTTYNPFSTADTSGGSSISSSLTPNLTKAQINYILTGLPDYLQGRAEGGHIEGHNPQFYSEGGLSSIENRFVKGDGDGTSDSIPAMLADGEFVIPADVVSSLGNGSNDAGASVLDQFLQVIREHKRKADAKNLPEDSKGPLAYLIDAQRRAKA